VDKLKTCLLLFVESEIADFCLWKAVENRPRLFHRQNPRAPGLSAAFPQNIAPNTSFF
jgi:hypothetical protein